MVKCFYEQEVVIKPKKKIEDFKEYARDLVKRCYVLNKIKEIREENGLIYIKFQYLVPKRIENSKGVIEFHFGNDLDVVSLQQKELYVIDTPNYFKHLAERLSEGEIPDEYQEFIRKLENGEDLD